MAGPKKPQLADVTPIAASGYSALTSDNQREVAAGRLRELEAMHFQQTLLIEETDALEVDEELKEQMKTELQASLAQLELRMNVVRGKL